jgi:hypothetical protein
MFESMERRRLLSSGATAVQDGSLLFVQGGSGGNIVVIFENPDVDNQVLVENNGVAFGVFDGVTVVDFNGQATVDTVHMLGRNVQFIANGNGGNDIMVISDTGSASSVINGGGNDDDLVVLVSNRTTLNGDGGADNIYVPASVGETAETFINGGGGADVITVEWGINHIHGGGGRDVLVDNSGGGAINDYESVETLEMG